MRHDQVGARLAIGGPLTLSLHRDAHGREDVQKSCSSRVRSHGLDAHLACERILNFDVVERLEQLVRLAALPWAAPLHPHHTSTAGPVPVAFEVYFEVVGSVG